MIHPAAAVRYLSFSLNSIMGFRVSIRSSLGTGFVIGRVNCAKKDTRCRPHILSDMRSAPGCCPCWSLGLRGCLGRFRGLRGVLRRLLVGLTGPERVADATNGGDGALHDEGRDRGYYDQAYAELQLVSTGHVDLLLAPDALGLGGIGDFGDYGVHYYSLVGFRYRTCKFCEKIALF